MPSPTVAVLTGVPASQHRVEAPLSPPPHHGFAALGVLGNSQSSWGEELSHCSLIPISLMVSDAEHSLMCFLAVECLPLRNVCSVYCPLRACIMCLFLLLNCLGVLQYSRYEPLVTFV